ncbi:hypothetical protein [Methylobacterium nigriterrae]|uniref:hypothetical protein n=1 Tax=Methylobacterium nigriterrae TaxID=3127512 RepID=UPI003013F571
MRISAPALLLCLAAAPVRAQAPAPKPAAKALPPPAAAPAPVVGCPSLANLRLLLRQARGDAGAAAARLADERADHLGCALVARDRVEGLADHVTLDGETYDCLGLQGTAICQWTLAGAVRPAGPAKAAANPPRPAEKPRR